MVDNNVHIEHIEEEGLAFSKNRLTYFESLAEELAGKLSFSTVLDAGCGSAQLVFILRRIGVNAYGFDISEHNLSHAPDEIKKYLTCIDIDSQQMPFSNGFFDLVVSHQSIEHFQNLDHFISEVRRVLKPKGLVMIETITPPFETGRGILRTLKIQQAPESVHPSTHSSSFWVRKFKNYGFRKVGNMKPFIRKTCVDLDPSSWWVGQLLLKCGTPGKLFWRQLAPYVRGTFLFEKD